MSQNKSKPKPANVEREIKTFNPTKSKVGKIIILILAFGFFASILITAIVQIVNYFSEI
ncbi:MAG: hypothetical protein Q8N15_02115 [Bacillota bacterium]|nr:hypothetical protein [Bacillota bacterium]